jgi:cysteine desulfurase
MIYLDNNSTTKINQRVFYKQCEVLNKLYGNPSNLYPTGTIAKNLINEAREQIALLINADVIDGDKILFTGCATESNNAVLHSALQLGALHKHIAISAVEHPSVMVPAAYYESIGCRVTRISVDNCGRIDYDQLVSSIDHSTVLVSIMLVNSETGIIHDVKRIVEAVKSINDGILVHTDAVQAAGKIPIDVKKLAVDFFTLSGHKFHAPKGVGVLYIRKGIPFAPFLMGGHQEFNLRAGTENTASIVAMGEAASIATEKISSGSRQNIETLRDMMEAELVLRFPRSMIFGKNSPRVGNTTNIGFAGVAGEKLVLQLAQKDICVSSGTACTSEVAKPSGVLQAMHAPDEYIRSIRISLSDETTEVEVVTLINTLETIIK